MWPGGRPLEFTATNGVPDSVPAYLATNLRKARSEDLEDSCILRVGRGTGDEGETW